MQIFDIDRLNEIWLTITNNKSRSFMTAFGVFWGMFMLVLMVGAGSALKKGVESQVEGFANNSCFFWTNTTTEPYKGFQKGRYWNMINSDVEIIKERVPEVQDISPMLFGGGGDKNVVRGENYGSFSIKGCYPSYYEIEQAKILKGRYINSFDIDETRKVCIIGKRVEEVLFSHNENPIGEYVKVNGIYFKIVGVIEKMAEVSIGGSNDESVIIPFSTMQKAFNQGNIIHFLGATSKPGIKMEIVEEKISATLKQLHQISPDDNDAVGSMNIEEHFMMFYNLFLGIDTLIWIVGLGTLLFGAIGVSSIMLVTVRERTKEIGIRRALGATPFNIISQILSESAILTLIAGLMAIIIGVGLLSLVGIAMQNGDSFLAEPQISFYMAISSLIILTVIGILAGFIPANRAIVIKPIDAIREE